MILETLFRKVQKDRSINQRQIARSPKMKYHSHSEWYFIFGQKPNNTTTTTTTTTTDDSTTAETAHKCTFYCPISQLILAYP
ncbi:MAG: hypothetical protein DBX36_01550 [Oscillospiraceae bacterium]|nr:MAG: hypothetical protein DBX36_01550 [Oscillospiraceae bacterium]